MPRRRQTSKEAARKRLHEMIEVHKGREDSKAKAQAAAKPNNLVECQPNTGAPLLRDEKARRDWVERELDICCQSFDLQRVLEGEKALRSEATRQLKEVEKKLVSLRSPAVALSSPMPAPPGSEQGLETEKTNLQDQIKAHSAQILLTQQQLMKAKSDEENKGGGAADARRWNGLRNVVESRALLKTAFRTASTLKAQVYETQTELTEAREELELTKLKLDMAEQEAEAAKRQAAEAAAALLQAQDSPGLLSPAHRRSLSREDMDVETLMQEIKQWDSRDQAQKPMPDASLEAAESQTPRNMSFDNAQETAASSSLTPDHSHIQDDDKASTSSGKSQGELMAADTPEANAMLQEDAEEEDTEEVEEGDGLDGDTVWDPDHATPWRPRRPRRNTSQLTAKQPSRLLPDLEVVRAQSEEPSSSSAALEGPVLMAINVERNQQGLDPAHKLTVQLLKAHLKGKLIAGQEWKAGSKKREDLMFDYRDYMGLGKAAERPLAGAIPSISLGGLASPPPKEEAPTTPRSSPWRENPAFLPPGTSKPGTEPATASQAAPQLRSGVSADLSDRLAGMSVVGSSLQRVREVAGEAKDSTATASVSDGAAGGQASGVAGRASALGRLKDRQQSLPRRTADEDGQNKATPAKFYLQQCTDAIKRAQILKEKMGLPKSLAMPAAPGQQPSTSQTPLQAPGSTALQQEQAQSMEQDGSEQGSIQRQGSLPSQQTDSGKGLSKAISMPIGASNTLRAYAAGAVSTGSPVLEGAAASPNSPHRNVLGEIGNGHDGVDLPLASKAKQKAGPSSAALNKIDAKTAAKDSRVNKAAWI